MDDPAPLKPSGRGRLQRLLAARVPQKIARDLKNRLIYGPEAPQSDECLFVDPMAITDFYQVSKEHKAPRFRRYHSGLVRGGDWDLSRTPITETPQMAAIRQRFVDGVSWQSTGLIDALMEDVRRKGDADGYRSRAELEARYARLEQLFDEVARTGRLRSVQSQEAPLRREHGGIFVHIARDGSALRSGGGKHRFAIARVLELPEIPVQVGVVHREVVTSGRYGALRTSVWQAPDVER